MRRVIVGVTGALLFAGSVATTVASRAAARLTSDQLSDIPRIVEAEISSRHVPGAVVLIGQGHDVVYRRGFGVRATHPETVPMAPDTVFDLASLTKVVATTTAVMQLVERGSLDLGAPVSRYWPSFAAAGKAPITVRDLMTHYSGLKPDLNLRRPWSGYPTAMTLLAGESPAAPPGTRYIYSDENFEALGELVRRVSGLPLDRYGEERIFGPLGMRSTRFRPTATMQARLAPTSQSPRASEDVAIVHDPTARRMEGVAGHAGLFSTADDLARFATMLLDGGTLDGVQVLRPETVALMTRAASPPQAPRLRALGWDLGPAFGAEADGGSGGSFGHTGFTGTMLWVDPGTRSYVVVLTNRTYPDGRGDAQGLRAAILGLVSDTFAH